MANNKCKCKCKCDYKVIKYSDDIRKETRYKALVDYFGTWVDLIDSPNLGEIVNFIVKHDSDNVTNISFDFEK